MARLTAEVPLDGYRLRSLPSSGGRMVDVGSNLGDQSIAAHLLRPSLQVLAIEPVPLTYFYLRLNLHLNRVQLLSLADFAHGQRAGVAPLHGAIVARPNANALTVPIRWSSGKSQDAAVDLASAGGTAPGGAAQMWATSAVPALHLPTLLATAGVASIDLLKVDCEGCEYALFAAADASGRAFDLSDRRRVARIAMELHVFLGTANRRRPTLASKAPLPMARDAERVLRARGCVASPRARGPGVRVSC